MFPLIVALFCCLFSLQGSASGIEALIRKEMELRRVPGIAYAVIKNGEVLEKGAVGFADLQTDTDASTRSVFETASVTKQFTATAIMMLVEQGKLGLNNSITEYLKDTPEKWKPIKVHHLLTHTSGLPENGNNFQSIKEWPLDASHQRMYESAKMDPLVGTPGEKWLYSDVGYYLLGVIIENVSGTSYADFLHRQIFQPLGMKDTRVLDHWEIVKNRAQNYIIRNGVLARSRRDDEQAIKSHYGVLSTIEDLIKYEASIRAETLLSRASYEKMWTPFVLNNGKQIPYGYGWDVDVLNGHDVIEHSGITGTVIYRLPKHGLTVIILGNLSSRNGFYPEGLAHAIASVYVKGLPRPQSELPTMQTEAFTKMVQQLLETSQIPEQIASEESQSILAARDGQNWKGIFERDAKWTKLWTDDISGISKRFIGDASVESRTMFLMEGRSAKRYWVVSQDARSRVLAIRTF